MNMSVCVFVCMCMYGCETVSVGVLYERVSVYLCVCMYGCQTVNVGVLYECVTAYLCMCGLRLWL